MKTIVERQLTSELVRLLNEVNYEPLIIRVHEKRFVVLREDEHSDSFETFSGDHPRTNLTEFFRNSPLFGTELDLERDREPSREVEF
ncbi:hypothetical protein [Desulfonema magnum]|uniref:Uncharacterized protein n=1 Tax=Desulfonema magnum TaxID=45655 RepID=A0A975BIW3_9BACT|nr:hypothetical protein [Desulfonema magnum]QTA86168.1 Uncharacterized protein dnm_021890 [Desulfonema magnum]